MPLKKGKSKKTISKNIETEMKKYKKTGKIGTSKPSSKKKAVKQAAAIAYAKAGKSKKQVTEEKVMKSKVKNLAKKDYDKDGQLETPEQEYKGSKDKAIKKSQLKESFDAFVNSVVLKFFIK